MWPRMFVDTGLKDWSEYILVNIFFHQYSIFNLIFFAYFLFFEMKKTIIRNELSLAKCDRSPHQKSNRNY